mgnify:CR=1 FL=1
MLYNPWHGCHKFSAGCVNCYVYRMDKMFDRDPSIVKKTKNFDLPIQKNRQNEYRLKAHDGYLYTCLSSDFFIEEADQWRDDVWQMIKTRSDLSFCIITKRIHRFMSCLPKDWNDGYPNVTISVSIEDQDSLDQRLPLLITLPIKHKRINCEPLLTRLDFKELLSGNTIQHISVGGESGNNARVCDYDWVLDIRRQCVENNTYFSFKQTGAKFVKDGKLYQISKQDQHPQAKKSNIDYQREVKDEKEKKK